jgi:hypothetical protein
MVRYNIIARSVWWNKAAYFMTIWKEGGRKERREKREGGTTERD